VEAKIKAGPKAAGLATFLAAWELLQESIVVLKGYRYSRHSSSYITLCSLILRDMLFVGITRVQNE